MRIGDREKEHMIDFSKWSYPFGLGDYEQQRKIEELVGQGDAFYTGDREDFETNYRKYLPGSLSQFIYSVTGTQAVESAIRIAQKVTGKRYILCYNGNYHGNSSTLLNSVFANENLVESIFINITPPYCLRCGNDCVGEGYKCVDIIFKSIPVENNIAALIIDPSFGNIVLNPGKEYFIKLKEKCKEKGILIIFDEIRTGFGRTNHVFAFDHLGIIPDILCLSKSIACGIPFALTIYNDSVISYSDLYNNNYHVESTFAGQKIALSMGLYTIKRIEKQLREKKYPEIDYCLSRLQTLMGFDSVIQVRNFGMIFAIEFINPRTKKQSIARATEFAYKLTSKGIITNGVRYKSVILLHPYINISREEIDYAVSIMHEVLRK